MSKNWYYYKVIRKGLNRFEKDSGYWQTVEFTVASQAARAKNMEIKFQYRKGNLKGKVYYLQYSGGHKYFKYLKEVKVFLDKYENEYKRKMSLKDHVTKYGDIICPNCEHNLTRGINYGLS